MALLETTVKKVVLFGSCRGFYDKKVLDYLENKSIKQIVAVRLYAAVQQLIASNSNQSPF
jgi:hypothetical protein